MRIWAIWFFYSYPLTSFILGFFFLFFFFFFFFYNTDWFLFFSRNLIYFPLWSIQSGSDPDSCIFHSFFPILWPVELAYSSSGFSGWTPVRPVLSELMYTRFSILKNRISVQFSIFPVEPLHPIRVSKPWILPPLAYYYLP